MRMLYLIFHVFILRYLGHLKKKVKQKARVEGSICQAYITEEASTFFNYYFEDHIKISSSGHRNEDEMDDSSDISLSIFQKRGRPYGKWKDGGFQTIKDFTLAKSTVLLNCEELSNLIWYVTQLQSIKMIYVLYYKFSLVILIVQQSI